MTIDLELEDGKYQVHVESGVITVKRHGQEWRDCTGDKLIFALVYKISELQEEIKTLISTTTPQYKYTPSTCPWRFDPELHRPCSHCGAK